MSTALAVLAELAVGQSGNNPFGDNPFGDNPFAQPNPGLNAQGLGSPNNQIGSKNNYFNDNPFAGVEDEQQGIPGFDDNSRPRQCTRDDPLDNVILQDRDGCPTYRAPEPRKIGDLRMTLAPICPDSIVAVK